MASAADEVKVLAGSAVDTAFAVPIPQRVEGGEAADVRVVSRPQIEAATLAAKSIGYNDPALGAPVSLYLLGLCERMGIAGEMKQKTVVFKQRTERFAPVARGEVEIGFDPLGEIIVQPGIDLVGPLPAPIQNYAVFTAAVVREKGFE